MSGVDWGDALALMRRTYDATAEGRQFVASGTTPLDHATHMLDLAGAAFATSRVAAAVGDGAAHAQFLNLSRFGLSAFNASSCMLRQDGKYYEGTFVNYGFRPMPDMATRIALCDSGGEGGGGGGTGAPGAARFVEALDAFFGYGREEPVVQMPIEPAQAARAPAFAQALHDDGYAAHTFEGLCNEPDMETPYSYAYAGRADRVQDVVTAVKTFSFAPGRGGLAGNDDSGGEAAWYVWASIGIFPVAGQPVYIIGSPSFASVVVHLGDATLRVRRAGEGAYVQAAALNAKPLGGRAWLWVSEAHAGGELVLQMGAAPTAEWGSVLPPSFPPDGL